MNSEFHTPHSMHVFLVGAGPGDPKLLTLRGREALEHADVVLFDSLISEEILQFARENAEKIFVGKRAGHHALMQDEINVLIVEHAKRNKVVCRLKGGDPFVFGRGGEEALFCRENNIPFEIVPGVSSAIAAPAYAGIPVTQRDVAASFAIVTGHTKTDDAPPANLPVADTLIFLMGVRALPQITAQLLARGQCASTPVALIRWGTTTEQQVVVGTLETIEVEVERAQLKPPALIVVGEVVRLREKLVWFDDKKQKPLWGQMIVVTRAREQASSLVEGLQTLGAQVLQCPTIRIEPLAEHECSALNAAIAELPNYDWIIFTSSNGVEMFWQQLRDRGADARALARSKIAAIGPATVEALAKHGLLADFVPHTSVSEKVAEGLLERCANGQRVLLLRALEGRQVIEETLRVAGSLVTIAPCYRTVPDASNVEIVKTRLEAGAIDWITFSSSSTVTNFVQAVGSEVLASRRDSFRVACIGPVTAQTATENNLKPDVVATAASVESLIEAIVNCA